MSTSIVSEIASYLTFDQFGRATVRPYHSSSK